MFRTNWSPLSADSLQLCNMRPCRLSSFSRTKTCSVVRPLRSRRQVAPKCLWGLFKGRGEASKSIDEAFGPGVAIPPQKGELTPLADLRMERLKLPEGAFGKDYVLIKLSVQGHGPYNFMVDTGLTSELITPRLQQELGITTDGKTIISGMGAGGAVAGSELVELKGAALVGSASLDHDAGGDASGSSGSGSGGAKLLRLPSLHAVVTGFPQERLDPSHEVEGMIGMEVLSMFDTDFDFPAGRLRLWLPGEGPEAAAAGGLVEVPAAVLNETGLLGVRMTSPEATKGGPGTYQPFVGILDCGSSFTAANWGAARLLGLPPADDECWSGCRGILSMGVDGRPMALPQRRVQLTYAGEPAKDGAGKLTFAPPAAGWEPWQEVELALGDLPVFSQLLGDGKTPFNGPAALIGLDILSQRRVMFCTSRDGGRSRRRRLFIAPKAAE